MPNGHSTAEKVNMSVKLEFVGFFSHSTADESWTFTLCPRQSHTYVNVTDFDLMPESVSQSGLSSLSLSKADSFSSQMARLSKFSSCVCMNMTSILHVFSGRLHLTSHCSSCRYE